MSFRSPRTRKRILKIGSIEVQKKGKVKWRERCMINDMNGINEKLISIGSEREAMDML